jgi:hypothetical protein
MMERVDKYVSLVREGGGDERSTTETVPDAVTKTVRTLQHLRLVCQEVAIQLEKYRRNPKSSKSKNSEFLEKANNGEAHYWPRMVQDLENTLHEFSHRHDKDPPKFKARRLTVPIHNNDDSSSDDDSVAPKKRKSRKTAAKTKQQEEITSDLGHLEKSFQELPQLQPFQEDLVIPDSVGLKVGDKIIVRLHNNRQVEGGILSISDQKRSFYVHYEDLPACFDEYQPIDDTKQHMDIPGPGEPSSSSHVTDESGDGSRTVQTVYCQLGGEGEVSTIE